MVKRSRLLRPWCCSTSKQGGAGQARVPCGFPTNGPGRAGPGGRGGASPPLKVLAGGRVPAGGASRAFAARERAASVGSSRAAAASSRVSTTAQAAAPGAATEPGWGGAGLRHEDPALQAHAGPLGAAGRVVTGRPCTRGEVAGDGEQVIPPGWAQGHEGPATQISGDGARWAGAGPRGAPSDSPFAFRTGGSG